MLLLIWWPMASRKYFACETLGRTSHTLMSSASVELLVFVLCFGEMLIAAPLPIVIIALVCPQQSSCVAYDASTYQHSSPTSPTDNVRPSGFVSLRYFSTLFSFLQSSSSHVFMPVVIKATVVCMSCLALPLRNSSCPVVLWKAIVWSSGNLRASPSSLTKKRSSAPGVTDTPALASGNESLISCVYYDMEILHFPGIAESNSIPRYVCFFPLLMLMFP